MNKKTANILIPYDMTETKQIFITYKHSDAIADKINAVTNGLKANGIQYSIDRDDLRYRENIREYEEEIGRASKVIIFVIPEYLESPHCMYELIGIIRNKNLVKRVFPLVDTGKYERNSLGLQKLKDFWCKEKERRDEIFRRGYSPLLARELKDIIEFVQYLDEFWQYICDVNTGNIDELTADNAAKLVEAIKADISLTDESASQCRTTDSPINNDLDVPMTNIVNQTGERAIYIGENHGNITIGR